MDQRRPHEKDVERESFRPEVGSRRMGREEEEEEEETETAEASDETRAAAAAAATNILLMLISLMIFRSFKGLLYYLLLFWYKSRIPMKGK